MTIATVPLPPVKLRYNFRRDYPGTWTTQGVGAQSAPYRRGWYPQLPLLNGAARAFCRVKKWLYVGGDFTTVAGLDLPRLFRMSLEDGSVDQDWRPDPSSTVSALTTDGSRLWVGGVFTTMGTDARLRLARFLANGALDGGWQPAANAAVTSLAWKTGTSNVYAGGNFASIGSDTRVGVAEIDDEGVATLFDAAITAGSPVVDAVAYELSQNMLYIGGTFVVVGGSGRNKLAKVDGDTGALDPWNPNPDSTVLAIAIDYPLVYVGGSFTTLGGGPLRAGIARVDQSGALDLGFDATGTIAANVFAISLSEDGQRIFAAGSFTGRLAGVDTSGATLSWEPGVSATTGFSVLSYKSTVFFGASSMTAINGIGSTTVAVSGAASLSFPLFRDNNTVFVKQTGLYQNAGSGTYADPKRDLAGVLGTQPSFNDQSAGGTGTNDLVNTSLTVNQFEGWTKPNKGYWQAGPFIDVLDNSAARRVSYLAVPSAIGTAIAATNAFTAQFDINLASLARENTIWDYQDAGADTVLSVQTDGKINFNLRGTSTLSAAGVIQALKPYTITLEKNPSGNLKRVWVTSPGQDPVLVIDTTQTTTMGAHTSDRLGGNRVNPVGGTAQDRALTGFLGPVFFFDTAMGGPVDWRDSYDAHCIGYYPMQTLSALELSVDYLYVCVLDSEVYEEDFNWHVAGTSLYAADGCAPTFRPRIGAKPGTFGARVSGREQFSSGSPTTFIYVSKTGSNSTGTRGDVTKPFLTVQGALGASGITAGDTVQIQDSAVYTENLTAGVAVTIQAADGKVPTIKQPSAASTFLTGNMSFYGMVIQCSAAGFSYVPTAAISLYDCTVYRLTITPSGLVVYNCANVGGGLLENDGAVHLENSTWVGFSTLIIAAPTADLAMVYKCSFSSTVAKDFSVGAYSSSSGPSTTVISHCDFTGPIRAGLLSNTGATMAASSVSFFRCSSNGGTFYGNPSESNVGGVVMMGVFFVGCSVTGQSGVAFDVFHDSTNTNAGIANYAAVRHCSVIDGSGTAFSWTNTNSNPSFAHTYLRIKNCAAINPGTTGLTIAAVPADAQVEGIAAIGASVKDIVGLNLTTFSTGLLTTGSVTAGSGSVVGDPDFISNVVGSENLGLSGGSPSLFSGDSDGATDRGVNWGWLCNQVPDAVFNGFTIEGNLNLGAGLENLTGVATLAEFLTFSGLGVAGLLGREGIAAYFCDGAQTNGPAFRLGGVSAIAYRNIAWSCSGPGFVWGAPNLSALNNSSWGCEYGHYDTQSATGTFEDSIHSDNGTDAVANEAVSYSDVGTISSTTVIGTGTTRKNPLYVDPFTGDLQLQTVETGYPRTSPAKGTGSDGGDMGAYEAEYGPLDLSFIELDMTQDSDYGPLGFSKWRNPDGVLESFGPIKLSEGDKPSGGSYSAAKAIKRRWTLTWKRDTDMPPDQLIALNEVYADAGPIAVSFDGATFIDCIVLKSNEAKNDQIDGSYTTANVPRPLETLVLQEL